MAMIKSEVLKGLSPEKYGSRSSKEADIQALDTRFLMI